MTYKAVIFDLDGTLLNTIGDIATAVNNVLQKHGLATFSHEEYRYFIGKGIAKLVQQVLPADKQTEQDLQHFYQEVMLEYAKNLDNFTKPYEGIAELLDKLTEQKIKLAILSNKADELMGEVVANHFAKWQFEVVYGARPNVPTKPDPYSAIEMVQKLGLSHTEILYVGDSDVDMQTANAANLYAVGVSWGFRSVEELLANGAKTIIDHPLDLLKLISS